MNLGRVIVAVLLAGIVFGAFYALNDTGNKVKVERINEWVLYQDTSYEGDNLYIEFVVINGFYTTSLEEAKEQGLFSEEEWNTIDTLIEEVIQNE
jgi:hypothetical protein